MKRIYHYSFLTIHWIIFIYLRLYLKINNLLKRHKPDNKNSIALLPYYPQNWPGGDRVTTWHTNFKDHGWNSNIYEAWSVEAIKSYLNDKVLNNSFSCYLLYLKLLIRRTVIFKQILSKDIIWIQRNIIPMFPFKKPYYERLLSKYHHNVIYDYYDADYESNYHLVNETVKIANKITVASKYLKEYHSKNNKNVYFLRYCIEDSEYIKKKDSDINIVKIGWMGSPENANHLKYILNELKKIEKKYNNILFSFVCRDLPILDLENLEIHSFNDTKFNYYEWLSTIDIGIIPFFGESERVKAKISKKCLEFMACGQIVISSPWVHSDVLINELNGFIVEKKEEWFDILDKVINKHSEYLEFGKKASLSYNEYHKKEKLLNPLMQFLNKK